MKSRYKSFEETKEEEESSCWCCFTNSKPKPTPTKAGLTVEEMEQHTLKMQKYRKPVEPQPSLLTSVSSWWWFSRKSEEQLRKERAEAYYVLEHDMRKKYRLERR